MSEFTCNLCKETYKKTRNKKWNDFKAAEEMLTLYPETKNDPTEIICDECNKKFRKWFITLTEKEKNKMRNKK
jgi:hypothetical protein